MRIGDVACECKPGTNHATLIKAFHAYEVCSKKRLRRHVRDFQISMIADRNIIADSVASHMFQGLLGLDLPSHLADDGDQLYFPVDVVPIIRHLHRIFGPRDTRSARDNKMIWILIEVARIGFIRLIQFNRHRMHVISKIGGGAIDTTRIKNQRSKTSKFDWREILVRLALYTIL